METNISFSTEILKCGIQFLAGQVNFETFDTPFKREIGIQSALHDLKTKIKEEENQKSFFPIGFNRASASVAEKIRRRLRTKRYVEFRLPNVFIEIKVFYEKSFVDDFQGKFCYGLLITTDLKIWLSRHYHNFSVTTENLPTDRNTQKRILSFLKEVSKSEEKINVIVKNIRDKLV